MKSEIFQSYKEGIKIGEQLAKDEVFDSFSKKVILSITFLGGGQNLRYLSHQLNVQK